MLVNISAIFVKKRHLYNILKHCNLKQGKIGSDKQLCLLTVSLKTQSIIHFGQTYSIHILICNIAQVININSSTHILGNKSFLSLNYPNRYILNASNLVMHKTLSLCVFHMKGCGRLAFANMVSQQMQIFTTNSELSQDVFQPSQFRFKFLANAIFTTFY